MIATTGNPAGTVHVWETRTGRHVAHRTAHEPSCTACAVLPDGSAVLTFGTDGRVRRWTLPQLSPEGEIARAAEPLTCGAISADGTTMVYAGRQGVAYVRSVAVADTVTELVHGRGVPLTGVALGPGGHSLVTTGTDGRVVLWDLSTAQGAELPRYSSPVVHCALDADGSLLAAVTDDGRVHLWDVAHVQRLATLDAHTTTAVGCSLSPDTRSAASVSGDGTVCLWDVTAARGSTLGGHDGLVQRCSFASDGTVLVTASVDGTVRRWSTSSGQEAGPPPAAHPGSTVLMLHDDVFPGGGELVLAAGEEGTVLRTVLPPSPSDPCPAPVVVGEHGTQVWGLAPLPGGRVVTAGLDGSCRVWDTRRSAMLLRYAGDGTPVRACATAVQGPLVASGGDSGLLHVWNPTTGHPMTTPQQRDAAITALATGTGNEVVTGDAGGHVVLSSPRTAWAPQTLGRHPDSPVTVILWAGQDSIVTCAADGTLALWPTGGDGRKWYRRVHRGPVYALAVSPSGSVIVSGGADGMLILSERATGRILARLPCAGRVHAVAVHPREPVVAGVGDGGLVRITEVVGLRATW